MLLKDKRVFIVEDNIQNRVIFQMLLTQHGARVEFERWGRDTINKLRAFGLVDLIILDLMLPGGVTGYDVYDEIRAIPRFNDVPVIAVSAADPSIAIPKTQARGFNGFIVKPIDDVLFPKQLTEVMNKGQVWYAGERT